jgi:hypothetical protein
VLDAAARRARRWRDPIGGEDDRLKGMLTERDIVVKVQGSTPSTCEH